MSLVDGKEYDIHYRQDSGLDKLHCTLINILFVADLQKLYDILVNYIACHSEKVFKLDVSFEPFMIECRIFLLDMHGPCDQDSLMKLLYYLYYDL